MSPARLTALCVAFVTSAIAFAEQGCNPAPSRREGVRRVEVNGATGEVRTSVQLKDVARRPIGSVMVEPVQLTPGEEEEEEEEEEEASLPMTKSVVKGEALEDAKQEGYSEAIKNVAGVSPANSKGTPNDSVNIRGS